MNRDLYIIIGAFGLVIIFIVYKETKVFDYNDNLFPKYKYSIKNQSSFNQINPFKESWCPLAKCFNSPLCQPCKQRYLFIIATGRSGSTTLLSMFNQLPNVRLSGENYNIVFKTFELLKPIEERPDYFIKNETMREGFFMHDSVDSGPFMHNAIPIGAFSCVVQHLHRTFNPPPIISSDGYNHSFVDQEDEDEKILGMKEIRLQDQDLISWTAKEAAKFLNENFPCSRYIINTNSNYTKQSASMKKYLKHKTADLDRKEVKNKIHTENAFLTDLSEILGEDTAQLIDIVEWKEDVSILNKIVDWLGYENCAFNMLIHDNYAGFTASNKTQITLGDNCKYPY
jgi:hypothetical protein